MAHNPGISVDNSGAVRCPDFQLIVRDGLVVHKAGHEGRTFELTDVDIRPSECGETLVFNGRTSRLRYDVAVWPELRGVGPCTYHVRVRFAHPEEEMFVLGRFAQCFVTAPEGWPQANGNPGGSRLIMASGRYACRCDRFYDVVMRLRPDEEDRSGAVTAEVYDADSGALLGRNHELLRTFDHMHLGQETHFTVGQGGRYALLAGEIATVNVWNEWMEATEIETLLETPNRRRSQRIKVRADLHDEHASARWRDWLAARQQFPIAAWAYFQRYSGDTEEYRVYRDANLTMVMAPLGTAATAEKVGLDTILGLWGDDDRYLELYAHPERMREFVDAAKAKLHRVAGYMLADEPRYNGPAIEDLRPGFEYLYANEANALPIVNLMTYPYNMGGGFGEYVDRFIRETHPPFLVSDPYVLYLGDLSNDDTFYANNEVVRRKALEADIGFMGFALTTGHKRPPDEFSLRTASESDLHWQANVLLAYGAQGLWYYNYRIDTRDGVFDEALVTHSTGQPTQNYRYVRKLNAGILANGALLMRLRSVSVYHCLAPSEPNSELTQRYTDGAVRGLRRLRADGVIVAEFEEQGARSNDQVYIMLVNRRHAEGAEVDSPALATSLTFELWHGLRAELFDSNTGDSHLLTPSPIGTHTLTLAGGARALLRLSTE